MQGITLWGGAVEEIRNELNSVKNNVNEIRNTNLYSFKVERNTKIRFCNLKARTDENIFGITLDVYPIAYYDGEGYGKIVVKNNGYSEMALSPDNNLRYIKSVSVYKSNTDGRVYFYIDIPNYNDGGYIVVSHIYPMEDVVFEKTDVAENWDLEMADKTLIVDKSKSTGGLYVNGKLFSA